MLHSMRGFRHMRSFYSGLLVFGDLHSCFLRPKLATYTICWGEVPRYPSTQVPLKEAMTSPPTRRPDCFHPINTELPRPLKAQHLDPKSYTNPSQ